jgi:Fe(3+) dicitrate transport protein
MPKPSVTMLRALVWTLTIVLASTATAHTSTLWIRGQVLDPSGAPMSGATVTLTGEDQPFERSVQTGEEGRFQFGELSQGDYQITASGPGYLASDKSLSLPKAATDEIQLALQLDPEWTIYQRIMVVGDPERVDEIPGAAHIIGPMELKRQKQGLDDIHRMLRQIPGVNIQEEEGYGLRPNIGMRGSGVDRSSKITLMEDGVLIAPAPYAAPSAYYFPTAGRMRSLEVRKGSSQIKYGPGTNGGVLNLVSSEIPKALSLDGKLGFGSDSAGQGHLNLGGSHGNFGWLVESYQVKTDGFKELDGGGDTGFYIGDYLAKLRFQTPPDSRIFQQFEVKLGATEQDSEETYLGLTDADFAINPNRRYAASQIDRFDSNHRQYQARYFVALPGGVDLTTIVYRNNFARNWFKLQSIGGNSISRIFGDPATYASELDTARGGDSDPDMLKVRANNRRYYSQGVQSVLGLQRRLGAAQHRFEFGFRYHEDEEDRLQHEDGFQMSAGRMARTSFGAPGSQSNRVSDAQAQSFFLQDEIQWNRWTVTPGIRYENIDLTRTDFSKNDPGRVSPTRVRTNDVKVVIPGVGVNFDANRKVRLFGGIHKGFSPPGPGSNEFTGAEDSINYEFGFGLGQTGFSTQLVAFYSDYDNLLGADTLAAGGQGTGDLFNGGEARVVGMEASISYDLVSPLQPGFSLPVQIAYTVTDGEFRNAFESSFDPWGDVTVGDKLPYLPRHQFYASFGVRTRKWNAGFNTHWGSSMRTTAGQGSAPLLQRTDAYAVLNLSAEYELSQRASLFANLQNVANNRYIVARRPAGVRPGLPRLFMAGIHFRLGRER